MKTIKCKRPLADIEQIKRCMIFIENCASDIMEESKQYNLMGNEVRLKILFLLHNEKRLCVCDLSDILRMNVSAVSQHLRKLKDRNLLNSTQEGQTIYYSLDKNYEKIFKKYYLNHKYIIKQ